MFIYTHVSPYRCPIFSLYYCLGKRLGHGMGYYDKYLKECFQKQFKKPYLIAVSFKEQIREDIPSNEDDIPVDIVLIG